ncbi:hypothetical protein PAEPH01_0968 [Pancytospora epiphaga]|nr:hypothetical protein PAEPH01_0968 [Pancytospora epiphaga]
MFAGVCGGVLLISVLVGVINGADEVRPVELPLAENYFKSKGFPACLAFLWKRGREESLKINGADDAYISDTTFYEIISLWVEGNYRMLKAFKSIEGLNKETSGIQDKECVGVPLLVMKEGRQRPSSVTAEYSRIAALLLKGLISLEEAVNVIGNEGARNMGCHFLYKASKVSQVSWDSMLIQKYVKDDAWDVRTVFGIYSSMVLKFENKLNSVEIFSEILIRDILESVGIICEMIKALLYYSRNSKVDMFKTRINVLREKSSHLFDECLNRKLIFEKIEELSKSA